MSNPNDRPSTAAPDPAPLEDDGELGSDDVELPADEGVDAELGDDPGSGAD